MSREFSKVAPSLWRSSTFRALGERSKILYLYYVTSGHVTSAGCYVLPDGYACADLQWQPKPYQQTRTALIAEGLIDHDPTHDEVLIEGWFSTNPPMNEKHAKGTLKLINMIQSDRLREKASNSFHEADAHRAARQIAKAGPAADARKPVASSALIKTLTGNARPYVSRS